MKLKNKDNFDVMKEAYKNIRTNIEFCSKSENIKTVLITSSKADEGKSTVLSNLSDSFTDMGKKVLLIDADLRNPSIHKIYGLHNNIGLADIINKEENFEDCVNIDVNSNLDILTSGTFVINPSELLSLDYMKEFIDSLKEDYDYIFIDSPPIGIVTDANIIASFVDSVILVVASNEVDKKMLEISKSRLDKVNANILGVVVNKYRYEKNNYYYGTKY